MSPEKRQHKRVSLPASVSITDTFKTCEGDVVDVSIGGMAIGRVLNSMLNNLPKKFTAVVSFRGGHAKVIMAPKWYKKEAIGAYSTVGFKIIGLFDNWHTFMRRATGITDISIMKDPVDVWGSANTKYLYR